MGINRGTYFKENLGRESICQSDKRAFRIHCLPEIHRQPVRAFVPAERSYLAATCLAR